jgi:hypothetical protein
VRRQPLTQIAQDLGIGGRVGGDGTGALADRDVVAEGVQHERVVRVAVCGVAGQQDLLLAPEVQVPVLGPVRQEARSGVRGGGGVRAAQVLGDDERLVVVAREGGERSAALHDPAACAIS